MIPVEHTVWAPDPPVLRITDGAMRFGHRTLWSELQLSVQAGEFITVLGANGTGKTSLFRAVLGQQRLTAGRIDILGQPVRRGDRRIGYVPQRQHTVEGTPVRARDLVGFGLAGHRFGLPWPNRARTAAVRKALAAVELEPQTRQSLDLLSGGEHQRLRIAQAMIDQPRLLLCDEPFNALDLSRQQLVSQLIDHARRNTGCAVLLITHDINPVLTVTDRVVYLANGTARVGPVEEVFTSDSLTALYQTPVDVVRVRDRIIVVGGNDAVDLDPAASGTHH